MNVVLCNCSPDEAEHLARTLVTEGLAACVNVLPGVRSFYVWDRELQDDQETTLLIKTSSAERLAPRLKELHSYDTPEILALPVDTERSDADYVTWVRGARPWTEGRQG